MGMMQQEENDRFKYHRAYIYHNFVCYAAVNKAPEQ